jgi:hypothetical protein
MNAYVTHHYDGSTHYDVYVVVPSSSSPGGVLVHSGTRYPLTYNAISQLHGGYIQIPEGDNFELHMADGDWTGDYFQAVYATSSGDITATDHGLVSVITAL